MSLNESVSDPQEPTQLPLVVCVHHGDALTQRTTVMVQIASGILGTAAAILALGAVHLEVAAGNDLLGPRHLLTTQPTAADAIDSSVNRTGKSDRLAASSDRREIVTFSFRLPGDANTSVMMRIPVQGTASAQPSQSRPAVAKRMVACEPTVSVLTSIARDMQPGRCVT